MPATHRQRPRPGGWRGTALAVAAVLAVLAAACGGSGASGGDQPPLAIGGIPDQDRQVLEERFGGIAEYLESEVGIPVRYEPSTSYAAVVTAFRNGDVQLGWFGGLTGVQARLAVDDAEAVAQRPRDTEFQSVFITGPDVDADSLEELAGLSFTFGSESSTSGHLMPRHFLREAGLDPDSDFDGNPGFSGSHDKTWKLVESGSFEAGALNETVWESAVADGEVDTSKVRAVVTTPTYHDYHWVVHPRIDETYGPGTTEQIVEALLGMTPDDSEQVARTLELFQTGEFIETDNSAYETIAQVARDLGLITQR